ncbi:UNVERIFIED_CONTAM: hypothetical protein H355_011145 [Colinus virginianus]|nr:hypothetical protein H355_011145 [Colinus virginianus]
MIAAPRRGEMPFHSVFLSSVPAGTLTPLKDLRSRGGSALSPPARPAEGRVLQSTLLEGGAGAREPLEISEIRPGPRPPPPKRRAREPPSRPSPAAAFLRMKTRAGAGGSDRILTPELPCIKAPQNQTVQMLNVDPLVLESPQKFFLRVKRKLQEKQQQQKVADLTSSSSNKQNVPPPTAAEKPAVKSAFGELPPSAHTKCVTAAKNNEDDFLVESVDADDEMSLNTATSTADVCSTPSEPGDQLEERDGNREAKHTKLQQEKGWLQPSSRRAEHGAGKTLEAAAQKPTQHFCSVVLSTPEVCIPRKQKENCNGPLDKPRTDQIAVPADKEKRICLASWRIKVMNGNTAVCVEGRRKDMKDMLWHSNAVVECIAYNQVKTSSGNIYLLQGHMDSVSMRKEGYPYQFIKRFKFGFSKRWKEHVEELLKEIRRKERKKRKGEDENEGSDPVVDLDVLENAEDSARNGRKRETRNTTYEVLPKNNEHAYQTPKHKPTLSSSNAIYTRSGRLVKPPLSFWCGEREFVDQGLNVTIQKGGIDYLSMVRVLCILLCRCPDSTHPENVWLSELVSVGLICKLWQKFRLNYFILKMYSTEKPKRKTSSLCKTTEGRDSVKTVEGKTKSQDKGKSKEKRISSKTKTVSAGSREARRFISDDESDHGSDTKKSKTSLSNKETRLNTEDANKHNYNSRTVGTRKEKTGKEYGEPTADQNTYSLRSAKKPLQDKPLTEESSSKDGEEESSDYIKLSVKRKNKPLLPQKIQNLESWSACDRLQGSTDEGSGEPRAVTRSAAAASHRVQLRQRIPAFIGSSDSSEEETSSGEEYHVREKKSEVSNKKANGDVFDTATSSAAKPSESKRDKVHKTLDFFSRAADGWSQKELQKLHRQVVPLSSEGKAGLGYEEA